ncbi:subtilisin-like protease SBT1.8 [Coffea eugenioides]|uniref:subtilisin-like protease SBT1.8 n=1 Tax=Coffea eugenioides TaxID=49369 RepID=UPI000F615294|nr:subtilisin-like protease SBT1.8 [Coffea eugenioides]
MEAAIADGVNVLSLSLGGQEEPYFADEIAIGAFRAIQNGIIVSCAAGNGGPFHGTLLNTAPWILTVGVSTIDRSFRSIVVLGNNSQFDGVSVHQPKVLSRTLIPLVRSAARKCARGTLNKTFVVGKVVLYEADEPFETFNLRQGIRDADGAAMIVVNGDTDLCATSPQVDVIPTTTVSLVVGEAIKEYINSTFAHTAMIAFEGVSILAAWPSFVDNSKNSTASFKLQCGTSMSTPHLSGIAALIQSLHPDWSPAAVKSAIMTSADFLNHDGSLILDERMLLANLFAIGAGHVNLARVADAGLVYDIHPDDYLQYLCGLNYTDDQIVFITQRRITCANIYSIPEAELNYPSFSIQLGSDTQTYRRTAMNVDKTYSVYNNLITSIPRIDIVVYPTALRFTRMNQKITYQISFKEQTGSKMLLTCRAHRLELKAALCEKSHFD